MRCKKHFTDLSSIVGVCASCLRERLFSLVAAQEQARSQAQAQSQAQCRHGQTLEEKSQSSDTNLVFPRSVSPYITRRKSDNSVASAAAVNDSHRYINRNHYSLPDQRYFSTPQVGPTYNSRRKKKRYSFIRFSFLSNLFRSKKRNDDYSSDPRFSVSNSGGAAGAGGDSATSAMSSPAWFSNIRSAGGGGNRTTNSYIGGGGVNRKLYCPDRGMSPVRYSDGYGGAGGIEDEFFDGSSGYESCESRKQTPWRTPAHHAVRRGGAGGGGGGNGKNVSGLTFCLSPLVRASPNRHWNQKGMPSSTAADGGDMRAPVKPHLSITKSFCANRSRKLADFGRFNNNR